MTETEERELQDFDEFWEQVWKEVEERRNGNHQQ